VKGLASVLKLLEVLVTPRNALSLRKFDDFHHFGFEIQKMPMPERQFEILTNVDSKKGYTGRSKEEKTKQ
jgi:hypothetical protein